MNVRYTDAFKKQLKRLSRKYRRIQQDISPIIEALESGTLLGNQIQGIDHTIFKVRAKNTDAQSGKSGGYRIIYYLQTAEDILLIAIYSKTEQSDIDASIIKRIIAQS